MFVFGVVRSPALAFAYFAAHLTSALESYPVLRWLVLRSASSRLKRLFAFRLCFDESRVIWFASFVSVPRQVAPVRRRLEVLQVASGQVLPPLPWVMAGLPTRHQCAVNSARWQSIGLEPLQMA